MLQTKQLLWLLPAVGLLAAACSPFSASPPPTQSESQAATEIKAGVEATVEAAIALAVEATVAAWDVDEASGPDDEGAEEGDATVVEIESDSEAQAMSGSADEDAVDAQADRTEEEEANEEEAVAEATTDSQSTIPMLITPTPDQSATIAQVVLDNTRHFLGDPDAPVTLVEFGDFW